MKQQLFCDHCDDILTLPKVVFAYGHKFCTPKCCNAWEQDHSRQKRFDTFEKINSMREPEEALAKTWPYRVQR